MENSEFFASLRAIRGAFDRLKHRMLVHSCVPLARFLSRVSAVPQTALHYVSVCLGLLKYHLSEVDKKLIIFSM